MSSIKQNFAWSTILTMAGYVFPLITYPYITRVLGAEYLGRTNFVDSIVNYFSYLSMMGMGVLGVREIAKCKNDKQQLSQSFSNLLALNLLTSLIAIGILLLCVFLMPRLRENTSLFYIGAARILFNTLLIEWFFKGIEDFRYITIRSLIIRVLYVISIFVFVRSQEDYKLYFILTSLITILNALCNIAYSNRFVKLSFGSIDISSYWKPFILLGVYQLLVTTYTTLNPIYLGFVSDDTQVGYFAIVTKLYYIILSIFTAFTGVMLPRMSALNSVGSKDAYHSLIEKSVNILFVVSFPIIIISEVCAPQIIGLLGGSEYYQSIGIMRIIMPLVFVVGYEQILVVQILTSLGKDKDILKTSIVGAVTALGLNILFVPHLYATGTAIVWVISELCVLTTAQIFVSKYVGVMFPFKSLFINVLYAMPIAVIGFAIMHFTSYHVVSLLVFSLLLIIYYIIIEFCVAKNQLIISYMNGFFARFHFRLPKM